MTALAPALPKLAEERLFLFCVAGSLAAHGLLIEGGWRTHGAEAPVEVEFDLTAPGAALGPAAPPRRAGSATPRAESWAPSPSGAPAAAREAGPDSPSSGASGAAAGAEGAGAEGAGGSGVTQAPRLLDLAQLDRLLQRYYPEGERRAGHEGIVLLDVSLDAAGHVVGVDVVGSSDPAFEPAARQVAARLRYAPARSGERPVSVKIRQPVQFRLGAR